MQVVDKPRMHEIVVNCLCGDIEECVLERYISDIRIAHKEIERLNRIIDSN